MELVESNSVSTANAGRGFIVGAPRSGTTLLMNLVAAHPQIAPVYETGYVRNLAQLCEQLSGTRRGRWVEKVASRLGVAGNGGGRKSVSKFRAKVLPYYQPSSRTKRGKTHDEYFPFGNRCIEYNFCDLVHETERFIEAMLAARETSDPFVAARRYIDRLFAIHCGRMGRPYWVNKTPSLVRCLDSLRKMFPDCAMIHIVRDGRDVALSTISLRSGPNNVRDAAKRWKEMILGGRRLRNDRGYIEIRYEDLIAAPEVSMDAVFAALRVERRAAIQSGLPVYRHREKVWRDGLSAKAKSEFAAEAGDLLVELGYEKDDAWMR